MSNYYYLVAQLPGLYIASNTNISNLQLPIKYDYFADLCSRFLSSNEMKVLNRLSLEPPLCIEKTGSRVIDRWYAWEKSLRCALAISRAAKMKKHFTCDEDCFAPDIQNIVKNAIGFDSPLEAELYLNSARIDVLNSMTPGDCFCVDAVYVYALKLKLLSRIMNFNETAGKESYKNIYNKILENK